MASRYHQVGSASHPPQRPRPARWAFASITAILVTTVGLGVALTARSNRWWWDNLAGFDSSNFVGSDQIKKDNVGQLRGMAWWSRQYFVVVANQGGGRGGGRPGAAAAPPVDPNSPIGAIAFALPEKK